MFYKILFLISLLYLTRITVHSYILIKNGKDLIEQSHTFPRHYYLGSATNPPFRYIVMGDSTAEGTGAQHLQNSYPYLIAQQVAARGKYVEVVNLAQAGARLADVLNQQVPLLKNQPAQLITVSVGANDATHFTALPEFQSQYRHLFNSLTSSKAQVIVASTPNLSLVPAFPDLVAKGINYRAQQQNKILQQLLPTQFLLANLYQDGKLDPRKAADFYANDQFHPQEHGYAIWGMVFIQKLSQARFPS